MLSDKVSVCAPAPRRDDALLRCMHTLWLSLAHFSPLWGGAFSCSQASRRKRQPSLACGEAAGAAAAPVPPPPRHPSPARALRALRGPYARACPMPAFRACLSLPKILRPCPQKRTLLQEPLRVLIYERYVDKQAYLEVHRTSAQFLQFRPALAALSPKIDGHSYFECPEGY